MTTNEEAGAGTAAAQKTDGKSIAGERKEGFDLFAGKPQSGADLSKQLQQFMGGDVDRKQEKSATAEASSERAEAGTEGEETQSEEGADQQAERREADEPEVTAGEQAEEGEEQQQQESEEEQHPESGKWPKSAISAIAEQREKRREITRKLEEREEELGQLRAQIEEGEFNRPLAATQENPLGFVRNAQELEQWTRETKRTMRLIEDFLDDSLDEGGRKALTAWAKQTGNVNESGELDARGLKQYRRLAEDALAEYVPQRQTQLREEAAYRQIAEKAFPFWKDKNSEQYKHAMSALKAMPFIRNLPHWQIALSAFALGMPLAQKALAGQGGAQGGAQSGQGVAVARPSGGAAGATPPKKVVATPGRSVRLPRTGGSDSAAALQSLRDKAMKEGSTEKDWVAYTRAQLAGAGFAA